MAWLHKDSQDFNSYYSTQYHPVTHTHTTPHTPHTPHTHTYTLHFTTHKVHYTAHTPILTHTHTQTSWKVLFEAIPLGRPWRSSCDSLRPGNNVVIPSFNILITFSSLSGKLFLFEISFKQFLLISFPGHTFRFFLIVFIYSISHLSCLSLSFFICLYLALSLSPFLSSHISLIFSLSLSLPSSLPCA